MNKSAIPWPIVRRIHSSKLAGLPAVETDFDLGGCLCHARKARDSLSSSSSAAMLFWNGYATHRFFSSHTYETRSRVFSAGFRAVVAAVAAAVAVVVVAAVAVVASL